MLFHEWFTRPSPVLNPPGQKSNSDKRPMRGQRSRNQRGGMQECREFGHKRTQRTQRRAWLIREWGQNGARTACPRDPGPKLIFARTGLSALRFAPILESDVQRSGTAGWGAATEAEEMSEKWGQKNEERRN